MSRRRIYPFLVLGVLALSTYLTRAQDTVRWAHHVPGDSKPILFDADEVSTWMEGTKRVLLLKGLVLVEHGVVRVRTRQAVVWIDQERKRTTGIYQVELFAEGEVKLEQGLEARTNDKAFIELSTRGEVKIKAHTGKVVQQAQASDPLYLHARAEKGLPAPAAPVILRTSAQQSAGAPGVPVQAGPSPAVPTAPTPAPAAPPVLAPLQGGSAQAAVPVQGGTTQGPTQPVPASPAPVQAGPIPGPAQPAPVQAGPVPGPVPPAPLNPVPVLPPASPPTLSPSPPTPYNPSLPPGPAANPTGPRPPTAPSAGPTPTPAPGGGPGPPATPGGQAAAPRVLRQFNVVPRSSAPWNGQTYTLPNGEQALVVTSGVILTVRNVGASGGLLDIEADLLVAWYRGGNGQQFFSGLRTAEGQASQEMEFYLAGNVEIRSQTGPASRTLRADEVYYDVTHNVAVALRADLEFRQRTQPEPIHLSAEELMQLSPTVFKAVRAEVFSSKLPSDPGLKVYVADATMEEKKVPKKSLFGGEVLDPKTQKPVVDEQNIFTGRNVFIELENVPIFYTPYIQGDANDPLGPLRSLTFNYDRIFGFQARTTWNVYDLFGLVPVTGTHWNLDIDYLSGRGPALGTDFDYFSKQFLGVPGNYIGLVKAYGIIDNGTDMLGGPRGPDDNHPVDRGRFLWRHNAQDLPDGFTVQAQVSLLSDKNFLEQYYKPEFDNDINQETFLYVKQQQDNLAWTLLTEVNVRNWVNETEWLPRADGYVIGESFFDLLTYNVHGSATYAQLHATDVPPPPESVTTQRVNTGRFDLMQELSLPFTLGPLRLVPYGVLDLTEYTEDLAGNERGRLYGGGGLRASMPLTRLYPDVQSGLFNLNGINHKIVFSANYYVAGSDTSFLMLPQLDRLNDDATDQSRRDINPLQPVYNPAHGVFLATSPLFDPQVYAIRRLVDNRIDTLDTIEELQFDVRQRWQTKRGYPGMQHIVDWMTLDLSGTYFPNPARDNFNESFAFLQYDWIWNIGDRTALVSSGWYDPIDQGARVYNFGVYFNRPDRTNLYLGFRSIFPVDSQLVTAAVTYVFSPKYALTASTAYDFGTQQSQSNSFVVTRTGTDLQVSFGITYNAILNNFGVTFEIFPNIVPPEKRASVLTALNNNLTTPR